MLIAFALVFFLLPLNSSAQYKITFRNGRELRVEEYREESGWIRATVFGGEVGLKKESLSKIEKITEDLPPASASVLNAPSAKAEPEEETKRQLLELDRQIHKAAEEVREAQKGRFSPEHIKQKELHWNRLRLERFRLSQRLNLGGKEEPAKASLPKQ
jgi:hypothetical protein